MRRKTALSICSLIFATYIYLYVQLPSKNKPQNLRKLEPSSMSPPTTTVRGKIRNGTFIKDTFERGFVHANSKLCPDEGRKIRVFIAVFSKPANFASRNVIRSTWGSFSKRSDVIVAFLIGSFKNETVERILTQERYLYGDIIQANHFDSYDNLVYKTLSMLDWVITFCSKSKFILKTDDDMFIHVSNLLEYIETIPDKSYAMFGKIIKNMPRFKNESLKHFLPVSQYNKDILPTYLSGPAYLIPVHLSNLLFQKSLKHPPFKLEDVFISGIIANSLKIHLTNNAGFYNFHLNVNPCNVKYRISLHNMNRMEQLEIWKNIHDSSIKCGLRKLYVY